MFLHSLVQPPPLSGSRTFCHPKRKPVPPQPYTHESMSCLWTLLAIFCGLVCLVLTEHQVLGPSMLQLCHLTPALAEDTPVGWTVRSSTSWLLWMLPRDCTDVCVDVCFCFPGLWVLVTALSAAILGGSHVHTGLQ